MSNWTISQEAKEGLEWFFIRSGLYLSPPVLERILEELNAHTQDEEMIDVGYDCKIPKSQYDNFQRMIREGRG